MAPVRLLCSVGIASALLHLFVGKTEGSGNFLERSGDVGTGSTDHSEYSLGGAAPHPSAPAEGVIEYVHLWTSADGETHLADCKVKDLAFTKLPGGESAQYVRSLTETVSGINTTNIIVTQQVGANPWHHCPQTQFVVTLSGTWFVNTTDGDQRFLPTGSWLFQSDTPNNPAAEPGTRKAMHYSEAVGPCNQMVLQLQRPPAVVDKPCPF
mmetsp:Transcript_82981/g.216258  ORF Transcript_82981/g.216258 Transcript_82981/m.216258 type:complete len:210 (+) Transcript_82981:81-710(+)